MIPIGASRFAWSSAPRHDDVVVLMAARFERWKGHDVLVEAAAQLSTGSRRWRIWIAGAAQPGAEQRYASEVASALAALPPQLRQRDCRCSANATTCRR